MKKMKRLASILLAVIMTLAMAVPTLAADVDMTSHTFKAYQIFSGTQNKVEDDTALGTVEWGSAIKTETEDNSAAFLQALKDDTEKAFGGIFASCTSAADVAKAISDAEWTDDSVAARAFAKIAYEKRLNGAVGVEIEGDIAAGYYLVVDETEFADGQENTVFNLALLQMTKDGKFEATSKVDIPSVEKKVQETNDSKAKGEGNPTGWQDAADYDINDDVPFQLQATMPTKFSAFETYKVVFHDKQSGGLAFNRDSVKVFVGDKEITGSFTVTTEGLTDGCTFEISCDDVKKIVDEEGNPLINADSVITVTYTSKLTRDAQIGSAGNPNEVYLEYSNNPNAEGTGKTPKDIVTVFTFEFDVEKVDEKGDPLDGAEFELLKYDAGTGTYSTVEKIVTGTGENKNLFEFKDLDSGSYKIVETKAPDGYNKIADTTFDIEAVYDSNSADPKLTDLKVTNIEGGLKDATDGGIAVEPKSGDAGFSGKVVTKVQNQKGSVLPETGGIGTTIFYVIGAVLVLGAGVLLITRKRMSKEQ